MKCLHFPGQTFLQGREREKGEKKKGSKQCSFTVVIDLVFRPVMEPWRKPRFIKHCSTSKTYKVEEEQRNLLGDGLCSNFAGYA
jgi:hypothetical protein